MIANHTTPAVPTFEDSVKELARTQGQFSILHGAPRYQVEGFTREVKGRRVERVLVEMRSAIKALLVGLMERIEEAALEDPNPAAKHHVGLIDFLDVRWTQEGRLVMLLGPGGRRSYDSDNHRAGIDELIEEVVARAWTPATRPLPSGTPESLACLASAVVDQFAAASTHNPALRLREVRFERIRWNGPELTVDITHAGRPLRPLTARFW